MCLGIPGEVVELVGAGDHAIVQVEGARRQVSLEVLGPEAAVAPGDWVLTHLGFALSKMDPGEVAETLELLRLMADGPQDPDESVADPVPGGGGSAAP